MKKFISGTILSLMFIFLAGGASEALAQSVTVSGSVGAVKRGGTAKGTIVMEIPGGLHVNSNNPGNEYAIPTTVQISAPGVKTSRVTYPRGKNRRFEFSDAAINVYEGRVTFTFNLTVPANYKGSSVPVRAVVKYQACTDEVCYPPKTKTISITAKVR